MSRIGFIGVGQMGAPMAERLLAAGREVAVFDVNAAAVAPLAARGAVAARSAREAASGAEIVFACLPSPDVSRSVAPGPDGIAGVEGLRIYVESSTIGTATIKAIAAGLGARGITVLDAPVSGGPRGARAGKLATMVAGDRSAFDRVKPHFDAICGKV